MNLSTLPQTSDFLDKLALLFKTNDEELDGRLDSIPKNMRSCTDNSRIVGFVQAVYNDKHISRLSIFIDEVFWERNEPFDTKTLPLAECMYDIINSNHKICINEQLYKLLSAHYTRAIGIAGLFLEIAAFLTWHTKYPTESILEKLEPGQTIREDIIQPLLSGWVPTMSIHRDLIASHYAGIHAVITRHSMFANRAHHLGNRLLGANRITRLSKVIEENPEKLPPETDDLEVKLSISGDWQFNTIYR